MNCGVYSTDMKIHHFLLVGAAAVLVVIAGYTYQMQYHSHQMEEERSVHQEVKPQSSNESGLTLPNGFTLSRYSENVPSVRVLAFDPQGVMLASLMNEGKVVALPDDDADGVADATEVLVEGLDHPHGILVLCEGDRSCFLYIAETHRLSSYRYDLATRGIGEQRTLAQFPNDGGHFTRSLHLHPDGEQILIAIGSHCNACEESDPRRASVLSYSIATGEVTPYASGLRNTVFMATDPVTGSVWGTDHGRDQLGDDLPPDEVNILDQGGNYGWPFCYGKNVPDTSMRASAALCEESVPSHVDLQAHSAPLGIAFVPEEGWPEQMRNDLLVAYHGSWNRSVPTGYKVVRFDLSSDQRMATNQPHDFLSGFLKEGASSDTSLGRPVAVVALPGGTAYVSDDKSGVIYKLQYHDTE